MTLYIGLMSGTSMDGIDAALVDMTVNDFDLVETHSEPYPLELRTELAALVKDAGGDAERYWRADVAVGRCFAVAALNLLDRAGLAATEVTAIGSHGQTVFHAPDASPAFTVQIGDPNQISEMTGITTVADFRRRDIAAGGQGAPLAPAFHEARFSTGQAARGVLNIGGISNITVLRAGDSPSWGFDTGPGNTLLDGYASAHLGVPMDENATRASRGDVVGPLLHTMLSDEYFDRDPPKSTGLERFNQRWLAEHLELSQCTSPPEDVLRTLCALTVEATSRAIERHAQELTELYVCGGGALNPLLMQGLAQRLSSMKVETTATLGIEPEWVEAAAFAWLAARTLSGEPGNLPSATGADGPRILGGIYRA